MCGSPESLICCASDLLSISYYDTEMVLAGQIILRYNIRGTMLPEHLSQAGLTLVDILSLIRSGYSRI